MSNLTEKETIKHEVDVLQKIDEAMENLERGDLERTKEDLQKR